MPRDVLAPFHNIVVYTERCVQRTLVFGLYCLRTKLVVGHTGGGVYSNPPLSWPGPLFSLLKGRGSHSGGGGRGGGVFLQSGCVGDQWCVWVSGCVGGGGGVMPVGWEGATT